MKTKTDKDIENFINSILNGEKENVISANEENLKIISNKNLRRLFLKYLYKLRNSSHLVLNDLSYKIIGNLLKESINHSYKEKDFISIKLVMVIATNLFKINKVSNKPRIFLHNYLLNNQIWKDYNFWESLVKHDIVEEMHNQKKYSLYMEENEVLKNVRIKDIVKAQLNTNIYNMNTFEVNTSLMIKIINNFSNYYNLSKIVVESFDQVINNCKSKRIELKEKKKLNKSFDFALRNKKIKKSNNICVTNASNNNSKNTSKENIKNVFSMGKDLKIIKNTVIEPVKQDEQKMNDCFEDIDKAIIKKSIFKDDVYNNIIVMESKSKKSENKEIINEK